MPENNQHLTNEWIKKKFRNNFDMANFAIKIGRTELVDGEIRSLDNILQEISLLPDIQKTISPDIESS